MSATYYAEIACDTKGCREHRRQVFGGGPLDNIAAFRKLEANLLLHGWVLTEGKYACPRCVEKHRHDCVAPIPLLVGLIRQTESKPGRDILYSALNYIQFPTMPASNGTVAAWENRRIAQEVLV